MKQKLLRNKYYGRRLRQWHIASDKYTRPNLIQIESLLHSLERAAGGVGFDVNADKTEYMRIKEWHLHTEDG